MQIEYIDGPRLRRSLIAACDYAQQQRAELNRINVFPVPDGDTGTNLALTVRAIADALRGTRERGAGTVAHDAAQAAVLGARGNCGMMLSHFLLGFAHEIGARERITADEFGLALDAGVSNLVSAIEKPMEGTIVTVMRDTAEAARGSGLPDFVPLVQHLVDEARESLQRTPDLLPVLRKAGVVDAGAMGFVSLLEGVLLFIHGDPIVAVEPGEGSLDGEPTALSKVEFTEETFRFCTEALVRGEKLPAQAAVRDFLRDHGDSLIVIRSEDVLKVHIHTDEPEKVFSYLKGVGNLVTHKAEDMQAQHETVGGGGGHVTLARRPLSIVTDSSSDLSREIVGAHGIHVTPMALVDGDRSYRDGIDITAEQFHARLDEDGPVPTTSQPAPADYMESFERAAEDGEAVLGVIVSSTLSGALASAEAAARRFHGAPVYLVDSLGASLLQGLLVLKASEMAERASPPEEIVAELKRIRRQSGILFTVDTFDRLLASGRVSRGRAILGSVLSVKPILGMTPEGAVVPMGKALGRLRARGALIDAMAARMPKGAKKVRFGIAHVAYPEVIEPIRTELQRRWGPDVEILTAPAAPVISTHLGTGAWGIAYIVED